MVLLHVKGSSEEIQFLFSTTVGAGVRETLAEIIKIYNMRQRISILKIEGEELGKYGPAKHPSKQGIDTYVDEKEVEKGEFYFMDPTGRRTGNACDPVALKTLMQTLADASDLIHKNQVKKKSLLTKKLVEDALDLIRGAVMICYPMGLPEWDLVRLCIEKADISGENTYGIEMLDFEDAKLWFAGKEMLLDNKLSVHLGRHENTKAIVKVTKKKSGAPAREPIVDEETQKGMLAYYYKKQEEQKVLDSNEDDDYFNSEWANPHSLRSHFTGMTNIKIPK